MVTGERFRQFQAARPDFVSRPTRPGTTASRGSPTPASSALQTATNASSARTFADGASSSRAAAGLDELVIPPNFSVPDLSDGALAEAFLLQQKFDQQAARVPKAAPAASAPAAVPTESPESLSTAAAAPGWLGRRLADALEILTTAGQGHAASARRRGVAGWKKFTADPAHARDANAPAFREFLQRLRGGGGHHAPAEYALAYLRPDFLQRVDNLLDAMESSPALRQRCFAIADEYTTSCGDRVTQGLNDMELARVSHDAETGVHSDAALFSIAKNMFTIDAIDKIAVAKIAELQPHEDDLDEIEIRLKYQTELAQRLSLPGFSKAMLYRGYAEQITDIDLDVAAAKINADLESSASLEYIARWTPWRSAMERLHPYEYRRAHAYIAVCREPLAIQPLGMSEQDWLEALDHQKALEMGLLHKVTLQLTTAHCEESKKK
jgi:hypothetical protein